MDVTETIAGHQDQYRQKVFEIIKELRSINNGFEELPYNYLSFIGESSRSVYGSLTSNRELLKFLNSFIKDEHQCLDPWSFPGSFSTLLTRGIWSGYSRNEDDLKDWKELTAGKDHSAQSKYDRVIGFMPFMMKADSYNTKIKGAKKYYTSRFLASIKNYLNNDAKVLVTFSKGEFNLFTDELSVNDGLCIKAVLSLPQYTWNQTSRESYLVWFELGILGLLLLLSIFYHQIRELLKKKDGVHRVLLPLSFMFLMLVDSYFFIFTLTIAYVFLFTIYTRYQNE